MSSNLKVNTILPSTGTAIGIGTASGNVDVLGHIVGNNTSNISGINSVTATTFYGSGANLTGLTVPGGGTGLDLNDNVKIRLGTGNDLEIYHGSGQNYVSVTGDGNLNLTSAGAVVTKVNSSEDAVVCHANGSVDLYHNNVKKLETSASGITVTGGITANANSAYSASIVFSDTTGIRLSHTNQTDGNDGTIAAGPFGSGLNIVGTRTLSSGNRQVRTWGDVFPSTNSAEKLGLSGNRWSKLYVNQILFGGDTATANEFDDYEEGSWTPTLPSGGSATMVGRYTKIGNTVLWQLTVNSISGAASFSISGLPFTVNNSWGGGISISNYGGSYPILVFAHSGNTNVVFRNTSNVTYNVNSFTGKFFYVHGFYYVNA